MASDAVENTQDNVPHSERLSPLAPAVDGFMIESSLQWAEHNSQAQIVILNWSAEIMILLWLIYPESMPISICKSLFTDKNVVLII